MCVYVSVNYIKMFGMYEAEIVKRKDRERKGVVWLGSKVLDCKGVN